METTNMPWSKEIEKAVLCFCGIGENQDAIKEITSSLRPEYFYADANKVIFEAICSMVNSGRAVDMPNLSEYLTSSDSIERAGGYEYITGLTDFSNSSVDYLGDCQTIKKYAMLRGIAKTCLATFHRAVLASDSPEEISQSTINFLQRLEAELLSDTSRTYEQQLR